MFKKLLGLLGLISVSGLELQCPTNEFNIMNLEAEGYAGEVWSEYDYGYRCENVILLARRRFEQQKEFEIEKCERSNGHALWKDPIRHIPNENVCYSTDSSSRPVRSYFYEHTKKQSGICCRNKYDNSVIHNIDWENDWKGALCKLYFEGSDKSYFLVNLEAEGTAYSSCRAAMNEAIQKLNEMSQRKEIQCRALGGSYKLIKTVITPACKRVTAPVLPFHLYYENVATAQALCCGFSKPNTTEYGGDVLDNLEPEINTDVSDFDKFDNNNSENVNDYYNVVSDFSDSDFFINSNVYIFDNETKTTTLELDSGEEDTNNINSANSLNACLFYIFGLTLKSIVSSL